MLQQAAKHVEKTNEEIVRVQVETPSTYPCLSANTNVTLQEAADKEETTPGRRARRSAATAAKLAMSYQVLPHSYLSWELDALKLSGPRGGEEDLQG